LHAGAQDPRDGTLRREDVMSTLSIAISMHVRCARCQSTIQIGAVVDRARCPKCGAVEALPPARWQRFLDSSCMDGPTLGPEAELRFDDDNAWIITNAKPPKCAACARAFPPTVAENARKYGKCFCGGCGAKIGVRPVPKELASALPRVTHLLQEDATQLKSPDAAIPDPTQIISVKCPDCGGNIQPDGKSRAVRCPYCSILVVLTQSVWARLHTGKNEPHTFYLLHDPTLPVPLGRADVKWSSLEALCSDNHGHLYGLGEPDESFADDHILFALDPQLKTKWIRRLPKIEDPKMVWRNDGVLFVHSERRYSALLFRAADGNELGKVGGEQPKSAAHFSLDLSRVESLAIDHDGTILFSKGHRLVRCRPDGTADYTWPPGQGLFGGLMVDKLLPFSEHDSEYTDVEAAGDRPTNLYDPHIYIGWDGRTYFERSEHVACYDRNGKKQWICNLPKDVVSSVHDLGVDARGVVYVLYSIKDNYHSSAIDRIMNGQRSPFIDGRNPATPIREERELVVHPNGTLVVGSSYNNLRIFGPDGRCLHLSAKALEEDQEHAKRLAEEAAGDRVR
jgi:DNA-directed RNA polymerase subunit RPC12/RpoP